jgi:hypothetical protein
MRGILFSESFVNTAFIVSSTTTNARRHFPISLKLKIKTRSNVPRVSWSLLAVDHHSLRNLLVSRSVPRHFLHGKQFGITAGKV